MVKNLIGRLFNSSSHFRSFCKYLCFSSHSSYRKEKKIKTKQSKRDEAMLGFENSGKLLKLLHGGEERTIEEIVSDFNTIFSPSLRFYACSALELLLDPKALLLLYIRAFFLLLLLFVSRQFCRFYMIG